jgi:sugar lactone lactonase YvrE
MGPGILLDLKPDADGLWLLSNADQESALVHYDLASARVVHKYTIARPGHTFNDLVIAPASDVYLTDARANAVCYLAKGAPDLTKLQERFEFANGIALSSNGSLLYVSTFPDGITVLD